MLPPPPPLSQEEQGSCQRQGGRGKSSGPRREPPRGQGLTPGTLVWAGGAGGGIPNHQTLWLPWLCSLRAGAGLTGPTVSPRDSLATGSPGLKPLKGTLCFHKEPLSLLGKLGRCHGDRGGLGRRGPTSWGGGVFQAEGTGALGLQPLAWTDSCPAAACCSPRRLSDLLAAGQELGFQAWGPAGPPGLVPS